MSFLIGFNCKLREITKSEVKFWNFYNENPELNDVISFFMSVVFLGNLCSLCNVFYDEFYPWSDFRIFKIFRGFVPD